MRDSGEAEAVGRERNRCEEEGLNAVPVASREDECRRDGIPGVLEGREQRRQQGGVRQALLQPRRERLCAPSQPSLATRSNRSQLSPASFAGRESHEGSTYQSPRPSQSPPRGTESKSRAWRRAGARWGPPLLALVGFCCNEVERCGGEFSTSWRGGERCSLGGGRRGTKTREEMAREGTARLETIFGLGRLSATWTASGGGASPDWTSWRQLNSCTISARPLGQYLGE